MADWFRWWHGTFTDAKFGLISEKAECQLCEVIAVWVFLLEHASQCHVRGDVSRFVTQNVTRHENVTPVTLRHDGVTEIAWSSRMRHETVTAIVTAMCDAGMIVDGRIEAWERRQPAREDAVTTGAKTAAQRAKEYRERKKLQDDKRHASVTQRHDTETPQSRAEKRREDVNHLSVASAISNSTAVAREPSPSPESSPSPAAQVCLGLKAMGYGDTNPHDFELHRLINDGMTPAEIVAVGEEFRGQGKRFRYVLRTAEGRRRDATNKAPLPSARHGPGGRMSQAEQSKLAAARAIFGTEIEGETRDGRVIDVTPDPA